MSGAEAGFVIGLISGVISIIQATKAVYDAANDAKGQPEAFRQVAARLPLVIEILKSAKEKAQTLDETVQEALEPVLESCKAKAENLNKIFQKVVRKDDDKWYDRYKKALGTLGKGDKVECLMEGILKDIQVLACERLIGTATEVQVKEIEEAIKQMNEMPSSLPDETGGVNQTHNSSGDNIAHTGPGTMNINKAAGDFYQSRNSGPVTFGNSNNQIVYNYTGPYNESWRHFSNSHNQKNLQDLRTIDSRDEKSEALPAETWPIEFEIPLLVSSYRNPNFTGRTKDLDDMHSFLDDVQQKKRPSAPLVLYGIGGVGKTQLVREFVFKYSANFSSIIWIDARNPQNIRNGFVSFMQMLLDCYLGKSSVVPPPYLRVARDLGISGLVGENGQIVADSANLDRIVRACLGWLEREGNTKWLLIFDNVDDLETFRVSDFFPNSAMGSIIVTSRRPECSRLGEGWRIESMGVRESINLLSKSYGRATKEDDDDYEEARRIVEKLGGLPLAIDQAGSYLSMLQKPLKAFLPLFEENFNKTLSKKPPSAVWQYGEETVVTTWEISFKAIQERDPEAANLLLLCSFLANNDISVDFLCRGLPTQFSGTSDIDDHISTLFSFSLADRKRGDSFSIHPIIHWWARERLSAGEAEHLAASALRMIACAIESLQSHNLSTDRQIMQHIRLCDEFCKKKIAWGAFYNIDEFRREWESFGHMYYYHGHNIEAVDMQKRALAGFEKDLGQDHLKTLRVVQNLGVLYHVHGQVKEAEDMWKRVLAGYEKALEPDHPDTLLVIQNLGLLYYERGQVKEAEDMWKQALVGYEKALEPDHPQTLAVVQNLGMLYHGRGQVKEAEDMWKRVLARYEKALEPDHPNTLRVVQNLGLLYHGRGQVKEAEDMWKRALAGYEKALEPDHPNTLRVVQNLGLLYHERGQVKEAEDMWKRVLAGYEKALEPDHPRTLMVVQNLGLLYYERGQVKEAEDMWKQVLVRYEKALEPDHPQTLMVVQNLGMLYHGRGQVKEAEDMWKRALAGYEKALEPDHPQILMVVQNLGMLYHGRGQVKEAEDMWKRALAGYEKALEPDHPRTFMVVQNLGVLYYERGQVKEAENMWKQALAGYEKALEPDHPQILMVVQNLGMLYHGRGQVKEAEDMWKRALAGYEKALEPDHPHTLLVVQNLGVLYYERGQVKEAENMWKQALAGYEKALEPDQPDTLRVKQNLGKLYYERGEVKEAEDMWKLALAGYEKTLEPGHPDILNVIQSLGFLYSERDQVKEEEDMRNRLLAIELYNAE